MERVRGTRGRREKSAGVAGVRPVGRGAGCSGDSRQSHILAVTQYCHYQYCMVYSIQKEGRGRGVPCAEVVRYYCKSLGLTGGRGNTMMIGSFIKALN